MFQNVYIVFVVVTVLKTMRPIWRQIEFKALDGSHLCGPAGHIHTRRDHWPHACHRSGSAPQGSHTALFHRRIDRKTNSNHAPLAQTWLAIHSPGQYNNNLRYIDDIVIFGNSSCSSLHYFALRLNDWFKFNVSPSTTRIISGHLGLGSLRNGLIPIVTREATLLLQLCWCYCFCYRCRCCCCWTCCSC